MSRRSEKDDAERIMALTQAAMSFVPSDRGEAMLRKWLDPSHVMAMAPARQRAAMADAVLLAADLLVSQPSASGATAFDRLAKTNDAGLGAEAKLLATLRQARFRLLRLEPAGRTACDAISGEAMCFRAGDLTPLADGTFLFARVARTEDGRHHFAGALTPLDAAAFAVARGHGAAGSASAYGNARWAEALYAHIVRYGTLEVPGINRPRGADAADDQRDAAEEALLRLAQDWQAVEDGGPSAALLQRTREGAHLANILDALLASIAARMVGRTRLADAFERMLLVMLETIYRRERSSSGSLTLDLISQEIDDGVARHGVSSEVRTLFTTLRQRVAGVSARGSVDTPDLAKLMQRIQGLRAKTVGQGCTEQEALAAAEKVAELLDRYGLSLGELDFKAQPCDGAGIQTTRRRFAPIDNCIPTIAEFFDCRVWLEGTRGNPLRYMFFGMRADVAAVQYLYELVERAFDTETQMFRAGPLYEAMAGARRSATNSFQVGLSNGICDKLRALQAARDAHRRSASGRDLVIAKAALVDEEMAKLGLAMHKRGISGNRRVLADAFEAGREAGERFEYNPAIGRAA
jgi:hypothetical protein